MSYDLAIIGAGAWGLALARAAAQAGRTVALIEQGTIGSSGASAGLLGALMPANANMAGPLSQVQLRCLSRTADRIAVLDAETGLPTGYRRAGRLQPLRTRTDRKQLEGALAPSAALWRELPGAPLRMAEHSEIAEQFPQFSAPLYGWARDGVTTQVQPRALLAALAQSVTGKADLFAQTQVLRIDGGTIATTGPTLQAKRIVVTAGWRSAALAPVNVAGVKGHAAAMPPILDAAPLLYARDAYVIFHDGETAIGSTTEANWTDTSVDADACAQLQDRAAVLVPQIASQPMTECWAGLRPKTPGGLPLVARVADGVIVATGGYKVGLALAFELADWLTAALDDDAALENFWHFVATRENLHLFEHA